MKESIVINLERKPIYSEMTAGKSDKVIRKLVFLERMMLPSAMVFDFRAKSFQQNGIPVDKFSVQR